MSHVHDVKSKIASLEAHNDTVRTHESPDRIKRGLSSPASNTSGPGSNLSNAVNKNICHGKADQDAEDDDRAQQKQSTTHLASQNRINRLKSARQAQPESGSLMQRRLSAKERRLASLHQHPSLQQKQQANKCKEEELKQRNSSISSQRSNSRQPASPEKQLTSPSSLCQTRSPARRPDSTTNNGGVKPSLSRSPNRKAAAAVAQQHRAAQYGTGSASPLRQQQQQKQQFRPEIKSSESLGSSGEQDGSRSRGMGMGTSNISRFHKLKMKGVDHTKLAQKRKEAAQKHPRREDPPSREYQHQHEVAQNLSASSPVQTQAQEQSPQHQHRQSPLPLQQSSSSQPQTPQYQHQRSPLPTLQHQTVKSQDSPDPVNTDDEATLTSVARILDQEQAFSLNRGKITTSPRSHQPHHQPSPSNNTGKPPRLWMVGEEKSDKAVMENHGQGIYPRPSSSSEYDSEINNRRSHNPYSMNGATDSSQTPSPQALPQQPSYHHQQQYPPPSTYNSSHSPHYTSPQATMTMTPHDRVRSGDLMRRSQGSYPSASGQQQFYQTSSARLEDDDRTFDYGVKDDASQESTTFQQQLLEADRKAREHNRLSDANTDFLSQSDSGDSRSQHERRRRRSYRTPRKKQDDPMDQYRQSVDSPVMKTAAGVLGAATVGCFVVGPVGMLLGAAAVGIGVGVMQIPEEQRKNMAEKAKETMSKFEEQAYSASEVVSNSCATTYKESGISEHIPAEMSKFCAVSEDDVDPSNVITPDIKSEDSDAVRLDQVTGTCGGGSELPKLKNQDPRKPISPNQSRSLRSKKVACLRHGKTL